MLLSPRPQLYACPSQYRFVCFLSKEEKLPVLYVCCALCVSWQKANYWPRTCTRPLHAWLPEFKRGRTLTTSPWLHLPFVDIPMRMREGISHCARFPPVLISCGPRSTGMGTRVRIETMCLVGHANKKKYLRSQYGARTHDLALIRRTL